MIENINETQIENLPVTSSFQELNNLVSDRIKNSGNEVKDKVIGGMVQIEINKRVESLTKFVNSLNIFNFVQPLPPQYFLHFWQFIWNFGIIFKIKMFKIVKKYFYKNKKYFTLQHLKFDL